MRRRSDAARLIHGLSESRMHSVLLAIAVAPLVIAGYAYAGYPLVLWVLASRRRTAPVTVPLATWPAITVTMPVYNAADTVAAAVERLLLLDYPRDRIQLLVVSDGSTDGTDDIVRGFESRGVQLHRLPQRQGKTAAENAAVALARGEIIVNVDATVIVPPDSLAPLIRAFDDPSVGVASGRDASIGDPARERTAAESSYVGYEMQLRDLETRVGSIVGASGCFYAIRRVIHATPLPPHLSWDFASVLVAREHGYRSVSVRDAICLVPRTAALRTESRRKVRTMARGLSTLHHKRALLNPFRYGMFAFMLASHKLLRWLPFLLVPLSLAAVLALSLESQVARAVVALLLCGVAAGTFGARPRYRTSPRAPMAMAAFAIAVLTAGFLAWVEALRQTRMATWDPTPRGDPTLTGAASA